MRNLKKMALVITTLGGVAGFMIAGCGDDTSPGGSKDAASDSPVGEAN